MTLVLTLAAAYLLMAAGAAFVIGRGIRIADSVQPTSGNAV